MMGKAGNGNTYGLPISDFRPRGLIIEFYERHLLFKCFRVEEARFLGRAYKFRISDYGFRVLNGSLFWMAYYIRSSEFR